MGGFIAEIVAELLGWYLDIKFWFKKKKRRKFEKENNLPKKVMIYPSDKIEFVSIILIAIIVFGFVYFIHPMINNKNTEDKLAEISEILENEKEVLGVYPKDLKMIIRNNPLRQNITIDTWGNDFQYQLLENGESYMLFSIGKDAKPNTDDDIIINN